MRRALRPLTIYASTFGGLCPLTTHASTLVYPLTGAASTLVCPLTGPASTLGGAEQRGVRRAPGREAGCEKPPPGPLRQGPYLTECIY